jgi:GNAT superfamily N-acetyltransferase
MINWTSRHPTLDDAQRTLDLMVRCDVSEYGEPDTDLEDLLFDWDQIDPKRDAWLAFSPRAELVGYGAVLPWGTDPRHEMYAEPAWEGDDLGYALLARCQKRGLAVATERQGDEGIAAKIRIAHVNQRDRRVVEQAGFQPGKHVFQMQMDSPPPAPHWPAGISVRTAHPEQDAQAIHRLIQAAFNCPGRRPQPSAEWRTYMMRADIFAADLWFLGIAGGEIVGACLCYEYPGQGWVRQLGVAAPWRERGLGTALLLHAFCEFRQRGLDRVGLTVESLNPGSYTFYQKVGMKRVRQYDEYAKPLLPGNGASSRED